MPLSAVSAEGFSFDAFASEVGIITAVRVPFACPLVNKLRVRGAEIGIEVVLVLAVKYKAAAVLKASKIASAAELPEIGYVIGLVQTGLIQTVREAENGAAVSQLPSVAPS